MQTEISIIGVLAMLALFVTGFVMWVAWEMITGRKGLSMLLALATFVATWSLAGMIGIRAPLALLLVEGAVALILVRVANRSEREKAS